jgi:hypothetical protein
MSFWEGVTAQTVASAPDGFTQFQIGENEAFIDQVNPTISKAGRKMLDIIFKKMDGAEIHYYIVDDEYKMQKLKQLYISFNIPLGNNEIDTTWKNKKGIVICKEGEPYNGKVYPKVSFLRPLIASDRANESNNTGYTEQKQEQIFTDDIPF